MLQTTKYICMLVPSQVIYVFERDGMDEVNQTLCVDLDLERGRHLSAGSTVSTYPILKC